MGVAERYGLDPGCSLCRLALQNHIDCPRQEGDREEALALQKAWAKLPLNEPSGSKHRAFGSKARNSRKH